MRRIVLPLAAALLAAPIALAHGEPLAQSRLAQSEFHLTHADGTTQKLRLTVTDASAPRITLQVAQCDASGCDGFDYYETRLDPAAVSLDDSAAAGSLRTVLRGTPLHVTWTPDDRLALQGGTHGGSGDGGEAVTVYRAEPAAAVVTFGGGRCSAAGSVGDEVRLEAPEGSTGVARPLDSFTPRGTLACAAS